MLSTPMKPAVGSIIGPILLLALACPSVLAQEEPVTEVEIEGEAKLLGKVADGTPPPPAPPRPMPEVKILSSSVRQEGGRTITMNRVAPPDLPPLPPPPEPPGEEELEALRQSPEYQAFLAEAQEHARKTRIAFVSATVYDHEKTRLWWWVPGDREQNIEARSFRAWSNVDFFHLGGFGSYEYDGIQYMLIMGIGGTTTEQLREWQRRAAEHGVEFELPVSPDLPADSLSYVVTEGDPGDAEGMAVMDGLHALYGKEKDRLAAAYVAREQAREAREAYLKANPPKPKDTVIHFWRRPREAGNGQEGGAR